MKNIFEEFDNQIDNFIAEIKTSSYNLRFQLDNSIEFILSDKLDDAIFDAIPNKQGLYLFEINLSSQNIEGVKTDTKLKNLKNKWGAFPKEFLYSPNIIEKRFKLYEKDFNEDWLPLYIGKCKFIRQRVLDHLNLKSKSRTYALKLKARKNMNNSILRISYISLDVKNYDFIAPFIETTLREYYNPIIGKQ